VLTFDLLAKLCIDFVPYIESVWYVVVLDVIEVCIYYTLVQLFDGTLL
jgi:hypothetical protein